MKYTHVFQIMSYVQFKFPLKLFKIQLKIKKVFKVLYGVSIVLLKNKMHPSKNSGVG